MSLTARVQSTSRMVLNCSLYHFLSNACPGLTE